MVSMEQISINKETELKQLVKLSESDLFSYISNNVRHFISKDQEENNNLTVNRKTTIYMGKQCFDHYTIAQIIRRLDKINELLSKFHNDINEIDFYKHTERISVTITKKLNLMNIKELYEVGFNDVYEDIIYIYNEEKQKSTKQRVYKLHFNLDVTKDLGFINQVNN